MLTVIKLYFRIIGGNVHVVSFVIGQKGNPKMIHPKIIHFLYQLFENLPATQV